MAAGGLFAIGAPDQPAVRRRWGARLLPPARLTWIVLALLGGYEVWFFRGMGVASLVAFPLLAVAADVAFQWARFDRLRFPDAAIATGMFITLLLPPTVPIVYGGAAAVIAIGVKHVLRSGGRPWINPAAFGTLVGIALFGLAPAWWVTVNPASEVLMLVGGAALIARSPHNWRLPAAFLGMFAGLSVMTRVIVQAVAAPQVLLLSIFDPATLFFGLYMVSEPRTAPRNPVVQIPFAVFIALTGVALNQVLPTMGILVALCLVGFGHGVFRLLVDRFGAPARGLPRPRIASGGSSRSRARDAGTAAPAARWSVGRRVAAGFVLLLLVGGVVLAAPPSLNEPPPGLRGLAGGGETGGAGQSHLSSCATDNPAIPASTVSALHSALGPSMILSYDPSTGYTVFYDPVDHVTVTETDLYEDYGYAEFNGDDAAVSGCVP
ncbi:MAG: RnfABCDGE type electron transport complex subunit D [Thermoplasmata archaeon]|nr:RnfABCDGE type electron transport complex subunit D [Thermoplasmata archaeon]